MAIRGVFDGVYGLVLMYFLPGARCGLGDTPPVHMASLDDTSTSVFYIARQSPSE